MNIPTGIQKRFVLKEKARIVCRKGGDTIFYNKKHYKINRVADVGVYVDISGAEKDELGNTLLEGYSEKLIQWEDII
jgi:hypothetical protein